LRIIVDYREKESGIIDLLKEKKIITEVKKLNFGDYIINNWVSIERKTAADFLISLINGRLFIQLRNLREYCESPLLLIEGNPFNTEYNFNENAIRGCFLSILTIWYIPMIFSRSKEETRDILIMIGEQDDSKIETAQVRGGYRPRKLRSQQLFVLQGFPMIGPHLAKRLLNHFKSISKMINSPIDELTKVKGIGNVSAKKIREVLDTTITNN